MSERNEAAERLRSRVLQGSEDENTLLDEALAAERQATVERIRERLTLQVVKDANGKWGEVYDAAATDAILDEEAAR